MVAIFRFFSSFGSSGRAAVWLGFGFAALLTAMSDRGWPEPRKGGTI